MKKIIITVLLLGVAAGATYVYINRNMLLQVSTEDIVKRSLPPYIELDNIVFDVDADRISIDGFRVLNPEGFSDRYLAVIDHIKCGYKPLGDNILSGINVNFINAEGITVNIEKLSNGRINVASMSEYMEESKIPAVEEKGSSKSKVPFLKPKQIDISQWLKITDTIGMEDGTIHIADGSIRSRPFSLDITGIRGELGLVMDKGFTEVRAVSSRGIGFINDDMRQKIKWVVSLDPREKDLTMANRIELSGVNMLLFRQYYEEYSPVNIQSGYFSGNMVFDFDHGNIGSMNTITLSRFTFTQKQDNKSSSFWHMDPEAILKYLQTSRGDFVFDFKIKGNMDSPRFYPGPVVKEAMKNLVVDNIADAIKGSFNKGEGDGTQEPSDADVVIDTIKNLLSN